MLCYMRCILTVPERLRARPFPESGKPSMKERIYTIPINEAFSRKSECPLCLCERKLEEDALEYALGPSMMEPDCRIETNRTGFCRTHFTKLYNLQKNRLSLGLVIDTHMARQIEDIEKLYNKYKNDIDREYSKGLLSSAADSLGRKSAGSRFTEELGEKLSELEDACFICNRMGNNMEKFIDVTIYLYFKEPDFRERFENSCGFCLKHFRMLLDGARKELGAARRSEFLGTLVPLQIRNLKRVREEVHHFTEMFDYRNQDGEWGNYRDAVPRSIEKLCGPCDLNR
jgi:hypothetical protein